MTRIEQMDTGAEIVVKMSDGNPGAVKVLIELIERGSYIDPDSALGGLGSILSLDTMKVYGSDIWKLYKDVCDQNLVRFVAVCRGHQLGFVSESDIRHAIDNYGEGLDVDEVFQAVEGRLDGFPGRT